MPTIPPISAGGAEWSIGSIGSAAPASTGAGSGFGGMLADQISNLTNLQSNAAQASASLADGTATDPSAVVTAVERAQLSMQLASQLRTKATDAINTIFQTQV
jgi:flagellar hook-basal body complex protein FliE